ncbi:MAG TPA: flagellar basal body-associated FliL family protein [Bacteroidota bacterium]|nr:flagellar basal body-associated FliL family protein [Bacteroidota bacterium]
MAKEPNPTEKPKEQPAEAKKPLPLKKLIMIGVPVFLVQIVVLFFVATKFVGGGTSGANGAGNAAQGKESSKEAEASDEKEGGEGAGSHMYVVKDLIVNPAGTNGTRFLLITVGFETSTVEAAKEMERKEIQVRDALNSVLTTKGLDELANVAQREQLRGEILGKASEIIKSGTVSNVYFSKFIIQ